ncbi:3-oxoacyl-[acyl-carrier-protein] synthase, KASIII, partial [hydrothermal vent metagenome]
MSAGTLRSVIKGTGSSLPRTRVSNAELSKKVDTTDDWIVERTGIRFRHIAEDDETTSSLATEAAQKALSVAGIDASE